MKTPREIFDEYIHEQFARMRRCNESKSRDKQTYKSSIYENVWGAIELAQSLEIIGKEEGAKLAMEFLDFSVSRD